MARLTALRTARAAAAVGAAGLLAVGAAGCGSSEPAVPCDDEGFRNQSEELYVAIATAQNAQSPGAPASVVADLRKGVDVLTGYLDANPPCADDLQELEEREREALAALEVALEALEGGEDAAAELDAAIDALGAVEQALR